MRISDWSSDVCSSDLIEKQIDENLSLSQDLAAARGEIAQHIDENQRLGQENEELRRMLHSVLRSIEQKTHMKTLQALEARVSALVAGTGVPGPGATAPAAQAPPVPADDAPAEMALQDPGADRTGVP